MFNLFYLLLVVATQFTISCVFTLYYINSTPQYKTNSYYGVVNISKKKKYSKLVNQQFFCRLLQFRLMSK